MGELKERGLVDNTLVIWGGEFGRTVYSQGDLTSDSYGRDHHPRCFSVWMANMALGLAHDGAVLLLAHGYSKTRNHIFGWRSTDSGRNWTPVNTSALGPNKTGSSTGHIVQLPGKRLMVVGHYRDGSQTHERGIWRSISEDDGLSWGEPVLVSDYPGVEPVLVRHENRLLVFIRGNKSDDSNRQFLAVSDD